MTPAQLRRLGEQLDALIRPLIAAGEAVGPSDSEIVHLGLYALPRSESPWGHPGR